MSVISLREYARIKSISYEAVRQQVTRYREELGDHVVKDGRQQFLDEEAVAFLDERRQKSPVVIYQENKDEELERLRAERQQLLEELNDAKNRIIAQQDRLYELATSEQKMLLLEAASQAAEDRAAQAEADRKQAIETLEGMRREAQFRADAAIEAEEQRAAAERRAETAEDIAELNAQEAARAKAEAEDLRAKLEQIAAARGFKRRKLLKELRRRETDEQV